MTLGIFAYACSSSDDGNYKSILNQNSCSEITAHYEKLLNSLIEQDRRPYLKALTLRCPGIARSFSDLGQIYYQQNRKNEALEAYNKSLKLATAETGIYALAGLGDFHMNEYKDHVSYNQRNPKAKNKTLIHQKIQSNLVSAIKFYCQLISSDVFKDTRSPEEVDLYNNKVFQLKKMSPELIPTDCKPQRLYRAYLEPGKALQNPSSAEELEIAILFDSTKSTIREEYYDEIRRLAEVLKKNPAIQYRLSGHTDNQGKEDYNLRLSLRRAKAVLAELRKNKVKSKLTVCGYGFTKPKEGNDTKYGRAQNRRVTIAFASDCDN